MILRFTFGRGVAGDDSLCDVPVSLTGDTRDFHKKHSWSSGIQLASSASQVRGAVRDRDGLTWIQVSPFPDESAKLWKSSAGSLTIAKISLTSA